MTTPSVQTLTPPIPGTDVYLLIAIWQQVVKLLRLPLHQDGQGFGDQAVNTHHDLKEYFLFSRMFKGNPTEEEGLVQLPSTRLCKLCIGSS